MFVGDERFEEGGDVSEVFVALTGSICVYIKDEMNE